MRNTTFISALAALLAALPAVAQEERDLMDTCYTRGYSEDHLAKYPNQTVAAVWVEFRGIDGFPDASISAEVTAVMTDTPATRAEGSAGKTIDQWTFCMPLERPWSGGANTDWIKTGRMTCFAECDGGMFQITKLSEDEITIKTNGLTLGEDGGCGGFATMADAGAAPGTYVPTAYKLFAAPMGACGG